MNYIKVNFSLSNETEWKVDLFKDSLLQVGFDSFVDTDEGFEAYAPEPDFKQDIIQEIIKQSALENKENVKYNIDFIADQNWNYVWEQTSPCVNIRGLCLIRKSSQEKQNTLYDIIINPKQSFGTATHPTTYMIIEYLLSLDMNNKYVMDMGCGTGVLGILSKKMGAKYVEAIDIDSWAKENTEENAYENNVVLNIKQGGAEVISNDKCFDIFIANINLNILKDNIPIYTKYINKGGSLILSGFYQEDIKELLDNVLILGYKLKTSLTKDNWALVVLEKQ
ncbi:MAG: 50S ribosomal protein L11 methyltransferase [Bacteroidales bacterium]|nr:50S ribosomal protein L11 methyltransferase [Bacteroidales bacterium]MDY6395239.1 50S ribosomal protein L11 methyltransferase [Bacteroidales bacterium]MDY6403079.1 50S ribosomal protein L11 methyltransferase [Bacteroidales bacterium]